MMKEPQANAKNQQRLAAYGSEWHVISAGAWHGWVGSMGRNDHPPAQSTSSLRWREGWWIVRWELVCDAVHGTFNSIMRSALVEPQARGTLAVSDAQWHTCKSWDDGWLKDVKKAKMANVSGLSLTNQKGYRDFSEAIMQMQEQYSSYLSKGKILPLAFASGDELPIRADAQKLDEILQTLRSSIANLELAR